MAAQNTQKVSLVSDKPTTYLKPKNMTPGQVVEGIYRNTYESSYKGKPTFTHYIEAEDETIGINGVGKLNKLMKRIPVNTPVTLTYLGKTEYTDKNGEQVEAHDFEAGVPEGAPLNSGEAAEDDKVLDD